MANYYSLDTLHSSQEDLVRQARTGAIFVYPTDTIYGIGAIVSPETIKKIDAAKQRLTGKHYSLIAPSFIRILDNFNVTKDIENERTTRQQQFSGRGLTLLLPYTDSPLDKGGLGGIANLLSTNHLIGVRYLGNHPFQQFVTDLGEGFITSSCNISGTSPITTIEGLPSELLPHVDICIDGGSLIGKPSVVINYETQEIIRE